MRDALCADIRFIRLTARLSLKESMDVPGMRAWDSICPSLGADIGMPPAMEAATALSWCRSRVPMIAIRMTGAISAKVVVKPLLAVFSLS